MNQEDREYLSELVEKIMDSCNPKPLPADEKSEQIRDYFACGALQGLCAAISTEHLHDIMEGVRGGQKLSNGAYEIADAMMKRRETK